MKPLILILLAAVGVQAQSIADAARKERARQAQVQTTKIFTNQNVKGQDSKEPRDPLEISTTKPVEKPAPEPDEAEEPAAPKGETVVDAVNKWTDETSKLRAKVRDLMDQDTAAQLEINGFSAQINAPVTSQSAKTQAQKNLDTAQKKLAGIRAELSKVRGELQEKDLAGPPPPKK